ncbi:ADP-ribosyl cyclase/cyclic ADP-ribose hydrolase 1 isoform X1 [Fundulus heteroclitus]|uniref:ADP-ribosyl cyclase/cyclic ADP-ribose hydrolase 1 isoform X1 n=1 Tax=Fundulus heteroclitus TaxID=8078 RepID=UPI00165C4973|nr:ADP-ribosyl cyclase/cyclic ADP-ribose hydrolase 1 isoform X1 [Fundulus heteroclitus]
MGFKTNVAIAAGFLLAAIVIVVPLAALLSPRTAQFRATFRQKCESFPETSERCEHVLSTFEKAYVGKDSCNFPGEAYHQLLTENPFTHPCGKVNSTGYKTVPIMSGLDLSLLKFFMSFRVQTMFWSGTKGLVHDFTKRKDHFVTLEDTLLGHIMNDLTWCGKKGSNDTFIYMCEECRINTVSSFWAIASEEFANYTCGPASVMLNGERSKPFDPTSYFGAIEVRRLMYPIVQSLTVILVTKNNKVDCSHESLQVLRNVLDPKVTLSCRSVTESRIRKCIEMGTTTEACWS